MSDETIKNTFQVTAPARVSVSNIRGSIVVEPGDPGIVEVTAVKHGSFDNGRYSVEMTQDSDGSVHIETHSNESLLGFLSYPPKVEYALRVPQEVQLNTSSVSSTLQVSGLQGVFKFKAVSGDMQLADLSGPLKLSTVSGEISGTRLSGVLDLSTVSGKVRLQESSFPSAEASTVSGDLILQTSITDGPYKFGSVSGSVHMLVPPDTHCNAELNSVSGNIRSSLPATATRMGHGLKVTQILGGGAEVRLKSVSGNLSFELEGVPATPVQTASAASDTPAPPVPPVPPSPSPQASLSTAEILQRIERGELTVDEAIRLMKNQS
ncbi:MAG: DUF4097 family beta strand repeat-containing protein [Acidobacteriaceae bacterium]